MALLSYVAVLYWDSALIEAERMISGYWSVSVTFVVFTQKCPQCGQVVTVQEHAYTYPESIRIIHHSEIVHLVEIVSHS